MTTATLEYRVYGLPIESKAYGMNEDGTLTIKGIASTTNKDYANEIVSPEVIKSLAKQAIGLNLHLDHERKYSGGIGAIINAWEEDNNLWVEAKILSEWAPGIKERLDIGMNFGFSISGFPRKERVPEGLLIVDYDLKEITLTYMPMNWDTFGTVEYKSQNLVASNCLTGACNHMLNATSDGETMDKKDNNIEEEPVEPVKDEMKDNTGLLTEEQLNQVKDVMNEYAAEFEPRILEQIEPKLDTIAENAANSAAEKVAERILAELKATEEVKSTEPEVIETEPVEETIEDEEDEELEEVKSEPGIKEPESAPVSEDQDDEDEEDEVEEKSIEEIVHNEIVKQMNDKNLSSKYDAFKAAEKSKSKSKMEEKSFLNSPKRDHFGRNRRYL